MNLQDLYKRIIMFCASLVVLAINTLLWSFTWFRWYDDIIPFPFFRRGNWLLIAIYVLLSFAFTHLYGGYKIGFLKRGDVIYSAVLSAVFVNTVTYLQVDLLAKRFLPVGPMLGLTLVEIILITTWAVFTHKLYLKLYPPHEMLVIYGSDAAESLIGKMNERADKYQILEMINIEDGLDTIFERIDCYEAVIICDVKSGARNQILKYCFGKSIRTYLTLKISDTIVRGADKIHLFDTPLLLCRNLGLSIEQQALKRVFDLLSASCALLLSLPVMVVTAAVIKLYDRGPIFYKQLRLTKDGKPFMLYKFRSMIMDAEKHCGARLASQNDDRITPVGRFIRKIRLDELPQLINIIKGDMSVVGPRPERPEIALEYEMSMPEFSFRLKAKAGLTGYAQVLGKYNTTPYDKLKLDLMYIENYSFLLDIQLILMTIKILFMPSSTEGVKTDPIAQNTTLIAKVSKDVVNK
ncbi:exopolysaccharide biosynthesis polyprenyl glycosylphosphotransferase [Oscillospiraceae bacterium PP1C4]